MIVTTVVYSYSTETDLSNQKLFQWIVCCSTGLTSLNVTKILSCVINQKTYLNTATDADDGADTEIETLSKGSGNAFVFLVPRTVQTLQAL